MSAALATNIIAFEPRTATVSVPSAMALTSFEEAARPRTDFAEQLEADAIAAKAALAARPDKKAGILRSLSVRRSDAFHVNPRLLKMKPEMMVRDMTDPANQEHVDQLARSIADNGLLEPILVTVEGSDIFVSKGFARILAVHRAINHYGAKIETVMVLPEAKDAAASKHFLRQIQRSKDKTPLERGRAIMTLINDFGFSNETVAEATGLTSMRVAQIVSFMKNTSAELDAMIVSGKVSPTQAENTLRANGNNAAAACRTLKQAVMVAETDGKTKATARFVPQAVDAEVDGETVGANGRMSKADVRKALEAASVETVGRHVKLDKDTWDMIRKFFNVG